MLAGSTSRGLALGVVLAATGAGMALWPIAAVAAIDFVGWRLAFPVMALTSAAVLLPLTLRFFYGAADLKGAAGRKPERPPIPPLAPLFFSRTFILLLAAACLGATASLGLTLHLVPILIANGFSLTDAANAAGLAGIGGVVGRLMAGYLLDRYSTRLIATAAFALPVLYIICLWQGGGSVAWSLVGALLLGLSAGGESDVVIYIASRRFDRAAFASLFTVFMAILAIAASMGPLLASRVYDLNQSYIQFFAICLALTRISALLIFVVSKDKTGPTA